MTPAHFLALIALGFALASLGVGVGIANELRARKIRAHPALVRWMIFRYLAVYRRVTIEETGRVGPLFHVCATLSALAAFFGVTAVVMLLMQ